MIIFSYFYNPYVIRRISLTKQTFIFLFQPIYLNYKFNYYYSHLYPAVVIFKVKCIIIFRMSYMMYELLIICNIYLSYFHLDHFHSVILYLITCFFVYFISALSIDQVKHTATYYHRLRTRFITSLLDYLDFGHT